MQHISSRRRTGAAIALAVALAIVAGACSSSNNTTSTGGTTTAAPGTTAAGGVTTSGAPANTIPKADVLAMQEMLDKVGCDVGPNDGIMGPETLGALLAFQKAAGLTPDDVYGPATKTALQQAVASGKKECVPPSTTSTAKPSGSTTAAPSTSASAASAPCTTAAIAAGLKANGTNVVNLDGIGCASGWAYAFATVSSGPPGTVVPPGGVGVTLLLQTQGNNWVVVDRAAPCANKTVPSSIYQAACQSN